MITWRDVAVPALLALAVIASAIGAVHARHESRKLFVELETLNAERDRLNVEWSRLQIEQGALSTHARVEQLARGRMQMRPPASDDVRLVTR